MLKKILLSILVLFLLVIAGFFLWRYFNYLKDPDPNKTFILPRVELVVVKIKSLTKEKTVMVSDVLIKNQMPFSFTADSVQYTIYMNNVEIMKSSYLKSIKLEKNDSSWLSFPVTIYNTKLDSVIKSNELRNIDSVVYRVKASFYTNIIFKKRFDIDIDRYLPLIYIPEVKMEKIVVDSLNFSRAVLLLHSSIINKNVFPLKSKDISFEFGIEDHEIIKGKIPGYTIIAAQDTTNLEFPVEIPFKEVRKTLYELLKSGSKVKYELHMTLKLVSDQKMLDESTIILDGAGTVKSLLKLVKK
jgi:LEA14-like dessication related protein